MIVSATSRTTGQQDNYENGTNRIVLDSPADVRLNVQKSDIVSAVSAGDDLVVTLTNGEQIVIENFFADDASGAVSRLVVDDMAAPYELGSMGNSGLLAAGLGALAAGAAIASSNDDNDDNDNAEEPLDTQSALDVLNAYTGPGDVAPTAEDYAAAGLDNLTPEQVEAMNELLPSTPDFTSPEEVQELLDGVVQTALDKIVENATDDDDDTDSMVETFGQAGVTGVTEDNLDALNTYLEGLPEGAIDSTEELQAIVDQVNAAAEEAAADALEQINDWDGSEELTDDNGDGIYGDNVYELLKAAGIDETIVSEEFLTNALSDKALANDALEAILDAVASTEEDLTLEELQALVDETVAGVLIDNMGDPNMSVEDMATALDALGVTGVHEANQDEIQEAIQAAVLANPALADSVEELQGIVDTVTAGLADDALATINAWAESDGDGSTTEPTGDDYMNSGAEVPEYFMDKDEDTIVDMLNDKVAATDGDLTADDVEDILNAVVVDVATGIISSYDDTSSLEETPTLADYEAMGVSGVTADNIDELNVLVKNGGSADTDEVSEIEALLGSLDQASTAAEDKIQAYKDDPNNNPEPTVDDYTLAGVEDVTPQTVDSLNELVSQLPEQTDLDAELTQFLAWTVFPERMRGITFVDLKPGDDAQLTKIDDSTYRLDIDRDGDNSTDNSIEVGFNEDGTISYTNQDQNGDGNWDNGNYRGYNSDGLMSYQDLYTAGGVDDGTPYRRRVFEYNEEGLLVKEDIHEYVDGNISAEPIITYNYSDHDQNRNWQYVERSGVEDPENDYTQTINYDDDGSIIMTETVKDGNVTRDEFTLDEEKNKVEQDHYVGQGSGEYLDFSKDAEFDQFGRQTEATIDRFALGDTTAADALTTLDRTDRIETTYEDHYGGDRTDIMVSTQTRFADGNISTQNDGYLVAYNDFDYVDLSDAPFPGAADRYLQLQYHHNTGWTNDLSDSGDYNYDASTGMADASEPMADVSSLYLKVRDSYGAVYGDEEPSSSTVTLTEEQAIKSQAGNTTATDDTVLNLVLQGNIGIDLVLSDDVIAELVDGDDKVVIKGDDNDSIDANLSVLADQAGVNADFTAYQTANSDVLWIDDRIEVV